MKYFITLFAIAAFASCDTSKNYECQCTDKHGDVLYTYEAEYKQAIDGQPSCTLAADSISAVFPNGQVHCQFYVNDYKK